VEQLDIERSASGQRRAVRIGTVHRSLMFETSGMDIRQLKLLCFKFHVESPSCCVEILTKNCTSSFLSKHRVESAIACCV